VTPTFDVMTARADAVRELAASLKGMEDTEARDIVIRTMRLLAVTIENVVFPHQAQIIPIKGGKE
jgi:hypothetical protein